MFNLFPIRSVSIETMDRRQDLFVHHHLGLGDMIHCNGMVRYLLQLLNDDRRIHVFCKARNLEMTAWMYRDQPRIVLESIATDKREGPEVRRILARYKSKNCMVVGHRALRVLEREYPHKFFDELFYMHADIPYSVRYSHCHWQRNDVEEERVFRKLAPSSPYAFVHDDSSRGYCIDSSKIDYPIVRNDVTESIFFLGKLLENAAEIHCMESSIRCMLESLDMHRCQLFYHNFRYSDRPLGRATRQSWTEITYPSGIAA